MTRFIDTHCHIHGKEFDQDRDEVVARMKAADLEAVTIGTSHEESSRAVAMARQYDGVYASVGQHPTDTSETFDIGFYRALAHDPKVVGIGECGLDYFRFNSKDDIDAEKARQKKIFHEHVLLAVELDKPLIIHCRPSPGTDDAHEELIQILKIKKAQDGNRLRGIIHFFTSTAAIAKQYVDLGFYISFSGVVTFAPEFTEVVKAVPLNRILSETDAPYASPIPHRGKRNEPVFVVDTVRYISEVRGEAVESALVVNAKTVFGIA